MNLDQFRLALESHPDCRLRFVLDGQSAIADHFHVTEVGRVEKRFVDCGGQSRSTIACVLQTLVAHDVEHRLTTTKLAAIMRVADTLGLPRDTPVEVEHQERSISLDSVRGYRAEGGLLEVLLSAKKTACLAEDACGLGSTGDGLVVVDGACGPSGCC